MMRSPRVLLVVAPLLLGACGLVAGLDAYEEAVTTGDGGEAVDASLADTTTPVGTDAPSGADGGSASEDASGPQDSGVVVVISDAKLEAADDTGAASDAMCPMPARNGQNCGFDAASCCSNTCDESHLCTGNTCKSQQTTACQNTTVNYVVLENRVHMSNGGCCVNLYCNLNGKDTSQGKCEPCLPKGTAQPSFTYFGPPVILDNACCSGQIDVGSGVCM